MLFLFSQIKYEEAKKAMAAKGKQLQQKVSQNTTANLITASSVQVHGHFYGGNIAINAPAIILRREGVYFWANQTLN